MSQEDNEFIFRQVFGRSDPMIFDNGLTDAQADEIDQIQIDLQRINQRIEALGRHRSYSLAQTQIEQAIHWMRDRKSKPS